MCLNVIIWWGGNCSKNIASVLSRLQWPADSAGWQLLPEVPVFPSCTEQSDQQAKPLQKVCVEFYCDSSCVSAFLGQTGCRATRGAGTQYQESGFLVQTHHTYCLHYWGGQEFLHSLPQPVCFSTLCICPFHLCILFVSILHYLAYVFSTISLSTLKVHAVICWLNFIYFLSLSAYTVSLSPSLLHQDFPRNSTWVKSVLKSCGTCLLRIWSMQWRVSASQR